MPEKPDGQSSLLTRSDIADHINKAFTSSDIVAICKAIGDATRLHNISDIAKIAKIERPSVYRAFAGRQFPNLTTTLSVLDAMGFQLKVTPRRGKRARLAKARRSESSDAEQGPGRRGRRFKKRRICCPY
jgi:probable addiction module antidote protein